MKQIALTQGRFAIVDDEDFERLNAISWCYSKGYAVHSMANGGHIYMHRMVNGTPKGYQTDHLNLDKLNNRRSNLRTATRAQNNTNRPVKSNSSSRFKGVYLDGRHGHWIAQIKPIGKKRVYLGSFKREVDAATAYNLGVALYGAEHTRMNIGG